jgi:hypothetical protein
MRVFSGFSVSRSLVVCAAFLAAAAHAGDNAFTVIGPEGGGLLDAAFHPTSSNVAYAATPSGLYRSSDAGSSWTLAKGDFLVAPFDIAVDAATPQRLYVAALEEAYVGFDDDARFT